MLRFAVLVCVVAFAAGQCGKPAIEPNPMNINIVGGERAAEGSWPWQVQIRKLSYGGQWCGATLIADQWVLSASHCFHPYSDSDLSDYEFVLGAHHVDDSSQYRKTYTASKIILHEDYSSWRTSSDVVLIKLSKPVTFNNGVSLACLATSTPSVDTMAYVTGWGNQEVVLQDKYLQQVNVPIVSSAACSVSYPNSIDDTMVCAGYALGGKDACQGDSGGPMVVEKLNTWYVAGVVSWGSGCADAGKYGVYADVPHFNTWIQDTMNSN